MVEIFDRADFYALDSTGKGPKTNAADLGINQPTGGLPRKSAMGRLGQAQRGRAAEGSQRSRHNAASRSDMS